MKKVILTLLFGTIVLTSASQDLKKLGIDAPWYSGALVTNEDIRLVGLIKYNNKEGVITFKPDQKSDEAKSFRENKILSMEYYDTSAQKKRKFYSIEYNTGSKKDKHYASYQIGEFKTNDHHHKLHTESGYTLFEIIKEFETFAVVSKTFGVDVLSAKNVQSNSQRLTLSQIEQIFFIDSAGVFNLYLTAESKDVDAALADWSKTSYLIEDAGLLKRFTGQQWQQIESFIKTNKLKMKTKEDLLKILTFYEKQIVN